VYRLVCLRGVNAVCLHVLGGIRDDPIMTSATVKPRIALSWVESCTQSS